MSNDNFDSGAARQFHQTWLRFADGHGLVERRNLVRVIESFTHALGKPFSISDVELRNFDGHLQGPDEAYSEQEFYELFHQLTGNRFGEMFFTNGADPSTRNNEDQRDQNDPGDQKEHGLRKKRLPRTHDENIINWKYPLPPPQTQIQLQTQVQNFQPGARPLHAFSSPQLPQERSPLSNLAYRLDDEPMEDIVHDREGSGPNIMESTANPSSMTPGPGFSRHQGPRRQDKEPVPLSFSTPMPPKVVDDAESMGRVQKEDIGHPSQDGPVFAQGEHYEQNDHNGYNGNNGNNQQVEHNAQNGHNQQNAHNQHFEESLHLSPGRFRYIEAELQARVEECELKAHKAETKLADLQRVIASLQTKLHEASSVIKQKEQHIQTLEAEVAKSTELLKRKVSQERKPEKMPAEPTPDLASANDELVQQLTTRMESLRKENMGYLAAITKTCKEKRDMEAKIKHLQSSGFNVVDLPSTIQRQLESTSILGREPKNFVQYALSFLYRHQSVMRQLDNGQVIFGSTYQARRILLVAPGLLILAYVVGQLLSGTGSVQYGSTFHREPNWWNGTLTEKYFDAFDVWITRTLNKWGGYSEFDIYVS